MPVAVSCVVDAGDVPRIMAKVVVEGANMPTLPAAEAALLERGIPVVPDFLANVMTNAWWWWIVFHDIAPTAEASFEKIRSVMHRWIETVSIDALASGGTLREAALDLAARNTAMLAERVG